jgi:RNA polymerase sigma-70 factor (ECF subfamily)
MASGQLKPSSMPKDFSKEELIQIVREAQEGSLDSFHRLYHFYSGAIYNFVWRLLGDSAEAEDLTQETFLKAHSEIKQLRDPAQFKYWLYRIARNEVYQRLRKTQRTTVVPIDDAEIPYYDFLEDKSSGLDPEAKVLALELNSVIHKALDSMAPKYRDVFVLAVFQKESYENISKVVGRSLLSVKTDIYRARMTVKKKLNRYLNKKK